MGADLRVRVSIEEPGKSEFRMLNFRLF